VIQLIEFIIGKIVSKRDDSIVIQNNGIGYRVFTSANTISKLAIGLDDQIIYTQLHSREDGIYLYGFAAEEEMDMFNLLLLVSKIGPKTAIGILSSLTPHQIRVAIVNNNVEKLCESPGVGKKTAERIIVELKDRIDANLIKVEPMIYDNSSKIYSDCIQALMGLGYTRYEVEKSISGLEMEKLNLQSAIKEGLKRLSKH
jgi:Holliday junction DNA helicase RuvA